AGRLCWHIAVWLAVGWVIGSALGLLLGDVLGDTKRVGLDAVFPASFVGAVVLSLRRLDTARRASAGESGPRGRARAAAGSRRWSCPRSCRPARRSWSQRWRRRSPCCSHPARSDARPA